MAENLAQHFLKDKSVVKDIGQAAGVETSDAVLEVGSGKGVLTKSLLAAGAKVVAVEKDPGLASKLENKFKSAIEADRLEIINKDIRDIDLEGLPKDYKVVANIPYYLTSDLLRQLLTADNQPALMVLLVQKEVAQRIVNTDKNSVLSVSVKVFGSPALVRNVNPGSFSPAPEVDSAILKIDEISREFFRNVDENRFFRLVKAGFAHKRKQLKNNLKDKYSGFAITDVLEDCDLEPTIRAESLQVSDWKCLYKKLQG